LFATAAKRGDTQGTHVANTNAIPEIGIKREEVSGPHMAWHGMAWHLSDGQWTKERVGAINI